MEDGSRANPRPASFIARKWSSLVAGWRRLAGPPPMQEFSDWGEYWDVRGNLKLVHRRWVVAAKAIEPDATVLDVGCGSGEFLRYLKTVRPDVKARGVDVSERAVEMTRQAGGEAERLDLTTQDIPGAYDYLTCFEVLEHIPEAEAALQRLKRAMRRKLIVSVPNIGYLGCRLRLALFGRFPITNCVFHIKEHVRHWTPRDFREWAAAFGLRVTRIEGQYGFGALPWRLWPSLCASGVVYILEHAERRLIQ